MRLYLDLIDGVEQGSIAKASWGEVTHPTPGEHHFSSIQACCAISGNSNVLSMYE